VKINEIALLFRDAFKKWYDKDPFRESAVIAYYAIFSLPGLLVLVITLAGYFLGKTRSTVSCAARSAPPSEMTRRIRYKL